MATSRPSATSEPSVDGRKTRYSELRARLLTGTIEYVIAHGVADLRMRPLAQALGVSPAALINHFGTKEALVDEVLRTFRDYTIAIARKEESAEQPATTWSAYDRWFENWTADRALPAVRLIFEIYALGFRDPERYGEALTNTLADWIAFPKPFLRRLGCPPEQLDDYATLLFAVMTGLQVDILAAHDRERVAGAHATFVRLLDHARKTWGTE